MNDSPEPVLRPNPQPLRAASANVARLPVLAILLAATMTVVLAGCARPTGDFGRAQPSVLHDEIMPTIGNARADASNFNLTDEEQEMRDRIWRYLVAPHAYDWFGDIAAEYQRTRIAPMSNKPLKTSRYYGWLHGERFVSSHVRFTRLEEDIIADVGMAPSAFRSICVVIELDRRRGIATNRIAGLEDEMRVNAAKRHAENDAAIDWFVRSLRYRYASYSYALDHLLVETPHKEAVGANAQLGKMIIYVEAAERGDFCSVGDDRDSGRRRAIRSRYEHMAPTEGQYRK